MTELLSLMRLRTLPLAFAVIITGNILAAYDQVFRPSVFFLSLLTALSLQILSNIANDYGDGIRGTDNHRPTSSPTRLTATGSVSLARIKAYIVGGIIITALIGTCLLVVSVSEFSQLILFLILGVLSIIAAITYTLGRYAYGYYGLGEISVFLFFGWVGVLGSYALQHGNIHSMLFLPASGAGLLTAAVLNINNIRDIETDPLTGKYTLAVRMGFVRSKVVHSGLLLTASMAYLGFAVLCAPTTALWLLLMPMMIAHLKRVRAAATPEVVAVELVVTVKLTLGINLLFCIGLMLEKVMQNI